MQNTLFNGIAAAVLAGAALLPTALLHPANAGQVSPFDVAVKTQTVDNLSIAYREAGNPENPTVLLLHGFPTSSHMFRNLIPVLAENYHVIAPDYPGFGASSMPDAAQFDYTFDTLTHYVEGLLSAKGIELLR